jgi:hypothetical protein
LTVAGVKKFKINKRIEAKKTEEACNPIILPSSHNALVLIVPRAGYKIFSISKT